MLGYVGPCSNRREANGRHRGEDTEGLAVLAALAKGREVAKATRLEFSLEKVSREAVDDTENELLGDNQTVKPSDQHCHRGAIHR